MKVNLLKKSQFRAVGLGILLVSGLVAYNNCGEFQTHSEHSSIDPHLVEEARDIFEDFLIEHSEAQGDRLVFQGHVVVKDLSNDPNDTLPPEDYELDETELEILELNRLEGVEVQKAPDRLEHEMDGAVGEDFNTLAHAVRREYLWSHGVIPYVIDSNVPSTQRSIFLSAAKEWQDKTKVVFVPRTKESTYLRVRYFPNDDRYPYCFASYGTNGVREVTFGIGIQGCNYAQMVHDLGHAIGIQHEHQRCDRDNYITVNSRNVELGKENAWSRTCADYPGLTSDMGSYDFSSIMHYWSRAYAKPGTVIGRRRDTGAEFSWSQKISSGDRNTVNTLYPYAEIVNGHFLGRNQGTLGVADCGARGIRQLIITSGGAIDRVVVRCHENDRTYTFGGSGGSVTRTISIPDKPEGLNVGEVYNWLGTTLHLGGLGVWKNGHRYFVETSAAKRWRNYYCSPGYYVRGLRVYYDNLVRSAAVICQRM